MVSIPRPSLPRPGDAVRSGVRRAADTPVARSMAGRTPPAQAVISRYVPGSDHFAAVRAARPLLAQGRHVTLHSISPAAADPQAAAAMRDELVALLGILDTAGFSQDGRAELSIRLSTLGQALGADGPRLATEHALAVAEQAAASGTTITLDMEDHTTTDATLETLRDLRATYPWVGVALQVRLRRTEGDCRDLNGVGSRVRLVKGEFTEPASLAHASAGDIDRAYARCLKVLVRGSGYPMVATHDRRLVDIAQALMSHEGRTTDSYEYQLMHGMQDQVQESLVAQGETVRVYLPYGPDAYSWVLHRFTGKPFTATDLTRGLLRRG